MNLITPTMRLQSGECDRRSECSAVVEATIRAAAKIVHSLDSLSRRAFLAADAPLDDAEVARGDVHLSRQEANRLRMPIHENRKRDAGTSVTSIQKRLRIRIYRIPEDHILWTSPLSDLREIIKK